MDLQREPILKPALVILAVLLVFLGGYKFGEQQGKAVLDQDVADQQWQLDNAISAKEYPAIDIDSGTMCRVQIAADGTATVSHADAVAIIPEAEALPH